MTELLASIAAGAVWAGVFALLTLAVQRRSAASLGSAILAAYPVFFAIQVVLANALGAAGMLTTTGVRVVYVAATLLGGFLLVRSRSRRVQSPPLDAALDPETRRVRRIAFGTAGVVITGLTLFSLLSPVHVWDVLAYHMPMIASYIQNASLDAWPTQDLRQIYRVNAGELQMLNVALLARSDAWVELPNLLALVVVLTAGFELGRLTFRQPAFPYVVILLVLTAPQIVLGAATGKNDLVFTAALLCTFYWMVRAGLSAAERTSSCVLLAALSAAIAGATKVMGLNVVGAVGLLALALALRRRLRISHVALYGGAAIAALLVLAGHIYLGNLGRTAVPVGIAPGEIHYSFGWINIREAVDFYLVDLTLKRLVRRPIFEHDFMHYGYLFPFMLVLGIAAAVRQLRHRDYVPACLALLGAALILSVIAVRRPISWDQRFMIWLVPTLAVLALSFVQPWLHARRVLILTWVAAMLAAGNLGIALALEYDGLFRRSARHLAATGSIATYLDVPNRRYAYMKDGMDSLDRAATARDSILYAGTDDSWMYPLWGRRFTRHVEGVWDAEHAAAQVGSRRFRFVVVEDDTHPEIRTAARARAAESGYIVLSAERHRIIFERADAPGSGSGQDAAAPTTPASGT